MKLNSATLFLTLFAGLNLTACQTVERIGGNPLTDYVFDVHFVVLTDKLSTINVAQLHAEVAVLNQYFVTQHGESIVRFKYKSATFYDDIQHSNCKLATVGDLPVSLMTLDYPAYFNRCEDKLIRDPSAINVYLYDAYLSGSFNNLWGIGFNNGNFPFIFLDYARLPHIAAAEEHEMGHAFGLGHVCSNVNSNRQDSNIMASVLGDCRGSSKVGARNIGFNQAQLKIIKHHAGAIQYNLTSGF